MGIHVTFISCLVILTHPSLPGKHLATGSGDTSVRFYDLDRELPAQQAKGHSGWVLCLAWAPDAQLLASGGMDGEVRMSRMPCALFCFFSLIALRPRLCGVMSH